MAAFAFRARVCRSAMRMTCMLLIQVAEDAWIASALSTGASPANSALGAPIRAASPDRDALRTVPRTSQTPFCRKQDILQRRETRCAGGPQCLKRHARPLQAQR